MEQGWSWLKTRLLQGNLLWTYKQRKERRNWSTPPWLLSKKRRQGDSISFSPLTPALPQYQTGWEAFLPGINSMSQATLGVRVKGAGSFKCKPNMARQPALISPKIKENTHLTQKAWKSSWIFPKVSRHRPCDYLPLSSSLISIYFFLQISTFHNNFYKSFPKERSMEIQKGGDIPIGRDDSFCYTVEANTASLVSQLVKNSPAKQETPVQFLGQENPLEKG